MELPDGQPKFGTMAGDVAWRGGRAVEGEGAVLVVVTRRRHDHGERARSRWPLTTS
ncbi:hypothetical protein [Streptomyces misionensis]|uniref:hypothetical protein n=1 Tax=Streptomyces misionensis TaxID=67331 RepID=UPI003BB1556A